MISFDLLCLFERRIGKSFSNATYLEISRFDVSGISLERWQSLEAIRLAECPLIRERLRSIARLPAHEELTIYGVPISKESVDLVAQSMPGLKAYHTKSIAGEFAELEKSFGEDCWPANLTVLRLRLAMSCICGVPLGSGHGQYVSTVGARNLRAPCLCRAWLRIAKKSVRFTG